MEENKKFCQVLKNWLSANISKYLYTEDNGVTRCITTDTTRLVEDFEEYLNKGEYYFFSKPHIEFSFAKDAERVIEEYEKDLKKLKQINFSEDEPRTPYGKQVGGDHYEKMAIQPIDYIIANNLDFLEGSAIKYISRWRNKNGVEDLRKAKDYIERLIKIAEENE